MSSSSGYRLRTAVSACAQPTPPSLNSPYLSTIKQYSSHHSGGCLKKFRSLERSGESFLLDKIKNTKKANSFNDTFCKRHKLLIKNSLNHCTNSKNQPKTKISNQKEAEHQESGKKFCWVFARQFFKGSDFWTKLEFTKNSINPKFLYSFLKIFVNESGDNEKGRVFCDETFSINHASTENNDIQNCQAYNNCIFVKDIEKRSCNGGQVKFYKINSTSNAKDCGCKKVKSENVHRKLDDLCLQGNISVVFNESERCVVDCWNFGVQFNGNRNDRQEILKWQPKHVMTRRLIQIVRKLCSFLETREFSKLAPLKLVGFGYSSEASEMLKCAEYPEKQSPSSMFLTYNSKPISSPARTKEYCKEQILPSFKVPRENDEGSRRKFSKGMTKYEVFLGGSCNPTTWRSKLAIPLLENMKITYFNPQIEEWRPELMEAEYEAKKNATVIFFVIDNQTRGVSALIEASHLAGNHGKLIVVFQSCIERDQTICGEQISEEEYEDLKAGQEVLQIFMERQGIPVFDDIKKALDYTQRVVRKELDLQELNLRVTFNRDNSPYRNPKEIFESLYSEVSGKIDVRNACIALKLLTKSQNISLKAIETIIRKSEINLNGSRLDDIRIDFDSFVKLVDNFENSKKDVPPSCNPAIVNDVYLGGTIEDKENNWRESVAIPMLKSQNLSYFIPKTFNENKQLTDIEAAAMESSSVLLFVIARTARSVAAMAIAGHYIGRGAKVVLCVQHLANDTEIGSEKLTESALKDYNRGRMYLTDIAKRNNVAVFDDISEAVELVITMCKNR